MSIFTELTLPTTLTDLLNARDKAIELHQQSRRLTGMTEQLLNETGSYLFPHSMMFKELEKTVIAELDQRMWTKAFDLTGFRQLMDEQAVKEFQDSLHRDTPEFTEDNIRSTFLELHQKSGEMFRRGIVRVFQCLRREYATHDTFKVKRKLILTYMLRPGFKGGMVVGYDRPSCQIDDIDRVFKTLDNQKFHSRSLETALNASLKNKEIFEDDYYRAKGFRNGNLHLEFKRSDLVDRVNEMIAEHYGEGKLAGANK